MASKEEKPGSKPSPGRNLPPDEAGDVAGAVPPPRDAQSSGAQLPEPGLNLEIETLGGAAAGATNPTIKVKINTSLDAD